MRFTAEDLTEKRGFCTVCDRGFDITPHTLEKCRALARAEVAALAAQKPPPRGIRIRRGPRAAVSIHPAHDSWRWEDWPAIAFLPPFLACVLPVSAHLMLWSLTAIPLTLALHRFRRQTVEFAADAIVIRRGSVLARTTRIARSEIHEVYTDVDAEPSLEGNEPPRCSHVVKIAREGLDPVVLGRGYGFAHEAARWLEDWLRAGSDVEE